MRSAPILVVVAACSEPFTPAPIVIAEEASVEDASVEDASVEHDEHDAGACETIGRTGPADQCLLFATCGHRQLEVDCTARFTCVCSEPGLDGGPPKQIAAQPMFCESAATELGSAFAAARRACGW